MSKVRVIPQAKCLILPNTEAFRTVFPHGKQFQINGDTYFGVKHGLDETRLLRRLGAKVPGPMGLYYSWPRKPWVAQTATGDLISINRRAYVLNDMGTGKTFAALAAADYLMSLGEVRKALFVAPVSTLNEAWRNEVMRWFPHRTAVILHASAQKRRELLAQDHDFYIVNHDGVEILINELASRKDIDLVVLDELAAYRNGRPSERSGKIRHRLWHFARILLKGRKYAWGLTGAPCPNEPLDAWAQIRLLTPEKVSWSWVNFRDKTMLQVAERVWVPRSNGMAGVFAAMQPAVRFKLEDCQDLPPVVEETRRVPMSATQQKAYDTLLKEIRNNIKIDDETGQYLLTLDSINEAVQLNKLMQVASGWAYDQQGRAIDLKPAQRLSELLSVVQGASHKVIVFVPYIGAIQGVAGYLSKRQIECATVYSKTSRKKRDAIFSAFQNTPKYKAIVAHPGTMSHGLTLTAANVITWYAPIHSLDTYIQANRRITRPGQVNRQVLMHLTGSPVEDRVYSRLRKNEKMQGILLDLFERDTSWRN